MARTSRTAEEVIRSRSSSSNRGEGASSINFWWRRCILHSRSPRCTTLPYVSAINCTSIWWAGETAFSIYTRPSPKALLASLRAVRSEESRSLGSRTKRMPFPPPPAAALRRMGYPNCSAVVTKAASSPSSVIAPGTIGTPAACAVRRAAVFSPIARCASAAGPTKIRPAAVQASTNVAFSDKKP